MAKFVLPSALTSQWNDFSLSLQELNFLLHKKCNASNKKSMYGNVYNNVHGVSRDLHIADNGFQQMEVQLFSIASMLSVDILQCCARHYSALMALLPCVDCMERSKDKTIRKMYLFQTLQLGEQFWVYDLP